MRNPYLDGEQAREEFNKLQKLFKTNGYNVKLNDGRSQILCINNKCNLIVMSSPANTLFGAALKSRIKKYNNLPTYVVLTRNPNEYPDKSINLYWNKIKKVSSMKMKSYNGLLIGLDNVLGNIGEMIKGNKLEKPYRNQIDFSIKAEKVIDITKLESYLKENKVSKEVREVIITLLKY